MKTAIIIISLLALYDIAGVILIWRWDRKKPSTSTIVYGQYNTGCRKGEIDEA